MFVWIFLCIVSFIWDDPLGLLKLFASRFAFVNDTVALALESYLGLEGPAREKRAWLEGLGELSRDVFGTAMQKDVDELTVETDTNK